VATRAGELRCGEGKRRAGRAGRYWKESKLKREDLPRLLLSFYHVVYRGNPTTNWGFIKWEEGRPRSLALLVAVHPVVLGGGGVRGVTLLDQMHTLEQIQVDADGLLVQGFVRHSRLADPVLGLSLEEHPEKIPQNFIRNNLFYELVVVLFSLE
jgi:hypothetical protein